MNFTDVEQRLEQFALQAAEVDRIRGEHHQALFDEHLFSRKSRLLVPYVKEAKSTLQTLISERNANRLTDLRAAYLAERLVSQIEALQRELSTVSIRKNELKHKHHFRRPINEIYQDLAQHKEWERRLMEMVLDKTRILDASSSFDQQEAQKHLLATEQRLKRCQEAIIKLENQITYREKNQ